VRGRNLISIADLSASELERVLQTALALKDAPRRPLLSGETLALVFEKPSLRTRVSFDVAMRDLGGDCLYLSPPEVGLGDRETPADVARVLSRYVSCIAARTFTTETVQQLADYATVPVINALSDGEHPCQALADLLTVRENKGGLRGVTLAYIGDGNNVANSLALAGGLSGMHIRFASPGGYEVPGDILERAGALARDSGGSVAQLREPGEAVEGADAVYTDVWASMGQESETKERALVFPAYALDQAKVDVARPDVTVLHCLPAHRGQEITDEVIDGPHSAVWDQAENRMHAQAALLAHVLASP
jgi:ornithine carbamoyltransferase